jgi:hypothetical protein
MSAGLIGVLGAQGLTQVLGGVAANRQAKENADILEDLGIVAAEDTRREVRSLIGSQRAAVAASGGDPNVGSALDLTAESASEGELAALRAQFGFDARAAVAENEGRAALVSGITGGIGTILGGSLTALGQNPSTTKVA